MDQLFKKILSNQISNRIFWFGIALCLLPFFLISVYNFPGGHDDIYNAVIVLQKGKIGTFRHFYETWTGRYTLIYLTAFFNPLIYENWLTGLKIAPVVNLTLFILSVSLVAKAIFPDLNLRKCLLAGAIFLTIYLFEIPAVSIIFYWVTGAFTYLYGFIFFNFFLACLLFFTHSKDGYSKILFYAGAGLGLCSSIGTNESCLIAAFLSMFLLTLTTFRKGPKYRLAFLGLLAWALGWCLFSLMAPGNGVRSGSAQHFSAVYNPGTIISATEHAIYYTLTHIVSWSNNLVLILASILFVPIGQKILSQNGLLRKLTQLNPLVAIGLSIFFLAPQTFPSYFVKGYVDARVWSSVYYFFLLAWGFNLLVLLQYFQPNPEFIKQPVLNFLKPVLILILLVSGAGNINRAYLDLFIKAQPFARQMQERYRLIGQAKGQDLVVEPLFRFESQYPATIFSTDISTEPYNYRNTSVSEYFNLKSIRLSHEPEHDPF